LDKVTCNLFRKSYIISSVHRIVFINMCLSEGFFVCFTTLILYNKMTSYGQCVSMLLGLFNLNKDCICIHFNKDIIIHFMNTYIIIKMFANTVYKQRMYFLFSKRACCAPTARSSRPHNVATASPNVMPRCCL